MNVQQLIEALQEVDDKTLPVIAEGCDCANPASAVKVIDGSVWIEVDL